MKIVKSFLSILLCAVLCLCMCPTVLAADAPSIKLTNTNAMPGDLVPININIENNPGIMAMAFCVTYDNDSLEFIKYEAGYISSFTYKDHSDKGHISFVNVENKDKTDTGVILTVVFKVKDTAKPGKHVITLANSNREKYGNKLHNSFSNSKQEFVVPLISSGSVTIAETCENSGHNYGEWVIVRENSCTEDGLKSHVCSRCDFTEEVKIPAAHNFENEWTVDKAATPEEDGVMSRHCTECDAKTDEFTFSYEEIGGETPDDSTPDDNTSSDGEQSSTDTDVSSDGSSENSSQGTNSNKPNIDNVVGEKVPQQEAEKFEEYKPPQTEENTSSEESSSEDTSSETSSNESETNSSNPTTDTIGAITNKQDKEPSFFATPTGIVLMVILIALSVGIIALGVIVIIRKQKEQ